MKYVSYREWKKELEKRNSSTGNKYDPSLIKAIIRAFWFKYMLYQQFPIWGEVLVRLSQPFLIGYLVRYASRRTVGMEDHASSKLEYCDIKLNHSECTMDPETSDIEHVSHGQAISYAMILTISSFAFAFSRRSVIVLCLRIANNVRIALTVMIYRKILKLSKSSLEQTDIGQVLNIISNDLKRFENVGFQLSYILTGPIISIIVIYISYSYLGVACIGGFAVLMLFIPFQGFMGRLFNIFR